MVRHGASYIGAMVGHPPLGAPNPAKGVSPGGQKPAPESADSIPLTLRQHHPSDRLRRERLASDIQEARSGELVADLT